MVASPCDEAQAVEENKETLQWLTATGAVMSGLGGVIQALKKR